MKNLILINPNHDGGILAIFSNIFYVPWSRWGKFNPKPNLYLNPNPDGAILAIFSKNLRFLVDFSSIFIYRNPSLIFGNSPKSNPNLNPKFGSTIAGIINKLFFKFFPAVFDDFWRFSWNLTVIELGGFIETPYGVG